METLFTNITELKGAHFSPCREYRYALWRKWDNRLPLIMFIGLNPSTANENDDDPTIRRVVDFAKRWAYGGVYMMNCFPLVSTKPARLKEFYNSDEHSMQDIENMRWLLNISKRCNDIIFAWGNFKEAKERGQALACYFKNARALQINKNGTPKHPLYVPGDIIPVKFNIQQ
jgi:hypothetical protein